MEVTREGEMTRERERKEERRTIRRKVPAHLPPLLLENASKKRKKGRGKTFSKKCNAIEGRADQEGIAENVGGPTEADFIEGGGAGDEIPAGIFSRD